MLDLVNVNRNNCVLVYGALGLHYILPYKHSVVVLSPVEVH